mgnify:CR=1 FL=1
MKRVSKYFLFSIIIFSLCLKFTAQQLKKEILFKHYDPVEYDFPAQILSIAEDSLGIKYFGTTSGILIYDGSIWKKLKTTFTVWSLFSGENGRIYVGGENDFGQIKTSENGNLLFQSTADDINNKFELQNQDFRNITSKNHIIYFASQQTLFSYNSLTKQLREIFLPIENKVNILRSMFTLDNNQYVHIENQGLYIYDTQFKKLPTEKSDEFSNNFITSGVKTKNELFFISSKNIIYNLKDNLLKRSKFKIYQDHSSPVITIDEKFNFVIYSLNDGLSLYNSKFELSNDMSTVSSNCHMWDNNGDLWIGALDGIYKINVKDGLQIIDLKKPNIEKIESIFISSNILNIGTYTSCYSAYINDLKFNIYGEKYEYFDIIEDPIIDGSLLIAGVAGVDQYKLGGKHKMINTCAPYTLLVDPEDSNKVWVSNFDGISNIIYQNGRWKDNGYVNNFNKDVSRIRFFKDRLFFSGNSGVFELLNRQYKNIKVLNHNDGISLNNMIVMEVFEDQLIVGTENGLFRFLDGNWIKMKIINHKEMTNQTVHRLKLLPNGQLWAVLYDPVDYYRFNTGYFSMTDDYNLIWHKTPFQNLVNELFNDFDMDENGNIWAGGNKYIAIYENDSIQIEKPKLLISEVTISDTMSIGYSAFSNYQRFFNKVPYKMNHISFDFTTLNFQAEDKVKFSYQLEGNMNNWTDWSTDKHIDFHNLREGKYRFNLKTKDVYDNMSDIMTFEFKISPPWYRTIIAYIIYFLLLISVIYITVRLANKRIQTQNEKLEKIVIDRTSEINKQKEKLELSYEQLNEAHEDIEQSINYAERLQQGILQPLDLVDKWLPNSFIFFRPKDVVSGDFYWVEEFNNIIYFAAADCTGHGIPGAMVSMICSAALNKSLYEDEIYEPARILDQTRQLVEDRFVRAKDKIKDGMDISLCSLEKEKGILKWAGANNPLWILRKGSEEVEVISPNKQPVGYVENPEAFTQHEIKLNNGDSVYVFSDGFQDQFGGEKGKKYMRGKMRKFVVSLANENMEKQKKSFAKEFDHWKRDFDQVDDICIIGVKV